MHFHPFIYALWANIFDDCFLIKGVISIFIRWALRISLWSQLHHRLWLVFYRTKLHILPLVLVLWWWAKFGSRWTQFRFNLIYYILIPCILLLFIVLHHICSRFVQDLIWHARDFWDSFGGSTEWLFDWLEKFLILILLGEILLISIIRMLSILFRCHLYTYRYLLVLVLRFYFIWRFALFGRRRCD